MLHHDDLHMPVTPVHNNPRDVQDSSGTRSHGHGHSLTMLCYVQATWRLTNENNNKKWLTGSGSLRMTRRCLLPGQAPSWSLTQSKFGVCFKREAQFRYVIHLKSRISTYIFADFIVLCIALCNHWVAVMMSVLSRFSSYKSNNYASEKSLPVTVWPAFLLFLQLIINNYFILR